MCANAKKCSKIIVDATKSPMRVTFMADYATIWQKRTMLRLKKHC